MKAIFFPGAEIPTRICPHRHGARMTYTEQTDSIFGSSRYAIEYYAHKYNARVGAFISKYNGQLTEIESSQLYGACKFDVYFPTFLWLNPSTGVIEPIPDFEATAWSQKGIAAFGHVEDGVSKINGVPVTVGSPKGLRTPAHGAQMYAYSNGRYGWRDSAFGDSRGFELLGVIKDMGDWYKGLLGNEPVAMSYSLGSDGGSEVGIVAFLQARNSGYTVAGNEPVAETWYGKDGNGNYLGYPGKEVTRDDLSSRPSSSRWYDSVYSGGKTKEQSLRGVSELVALTLRNGGWANNFTHWHNLQGQADEEMRLHAYDDYFSAISRAAGDNHVHFCSYGEASEYLFYRCCVDNIAAYRKGNRVAVALSVVDNFKNSVLSGSGLDGKLPLGRIKTPISIEVDLTGTFLEGRNVRTTYGKAIDSGDNKVIVEIPFPSRGQGVVEIEIFDNIQPEWKSPGKPFISNLVEKDGDVTFMTNHPCHSCVFEITDIDNIALSQRNMGDLKTGHHFSFAKSEGKKYAVGIINECGVTALRDIE